MTTFSPKTCDEMEAQARACMRAARQALFSVQSKCCRYKHDDLYLSVEDAKQIAELARVCSRSLEACCLTAAAFE